MAREIAFEDIRKGDDIEARYAGDGVTFTRRGIVHGPTDRPTSRNWYTEAGGLIASDYDDWKFYLHSRPAPAEPMSLGAVVRATVNGNRWTLHRIKPPGGGKSWVNVVLNLYAWSDFDPDSIEVLSEGIEVES